MIVSASRRTDLPALHAQWLAARMDEGRVEVSNPFNRSTRRVVDLVPAPLGTMEALILWTRNPGPLLPLVPEWEKRGVRSLWLITLTGYPKLLEPAAPDPGESVKAIKRLAKLIGPERIAWRYDPVFASRSLSMGPGYHAANFARLADVLLGSAGRVIISVYDDYARAAKRLSAAGIDFDAESAFESCAVIAETASASGLAVQSCSEELTRFGVQPAGCIDPALINSLWSLDLSPGRDPGQRPLCRCAPSVDIGSYGTCGHGCLYCYACR